MTALRVRRVLLAVLVQCSAMVPLPGLDLARADHGPKDPQGGADQAPKDPPGMVRMSAEQQKTVGLQTAVATRREITEPLHVPGTVAFDQGHVAMLRASAQARVLQVLVQPGEAVRRGQAMAQIYMATLAESQASLAAARADLREKVAGVAVARDSYRRGEILARDGSMARAEAEQRRLVLAQAQAGSDGAAARQAALQAEVTRLAPGGAPGVAMLTSPIAGVVAAVGATPGGLLDPTGEAFTVADLSVVLVLAQVPEASVRLLAVGDAAAVTGAAGGEHWQGRVVTLGAALDPQARTLPVRIQIANPDGVLRAGMFVDVTLTSDRQPDDLTVPAASVQLLGDRRVAFTSLGGDRFQSHELTLGVERPDWVEVRHGLDAGDTVVTQGSFALKSLLQKALLGGSG